jgi:hypothetical protein
MERPLFWRGLLPRDLVNGDDLLREATHPFAVGGVERKNNMGDAGGDIFVDLTAGVAQFKGTGPLPSS